VQVWDEHKSEYFGLKAILFMIVSDSPAARNMSGQSKKVGHGCPKYFREIDSQYLSGSQKNNVHGTSMLHSNETPVSEYEGSIQW
jgi:hypothetical protein